MLLDPMVKYFSQFHDLYKKIDQTHVKEMCEVKKAHFFSKSMCEFVSILKRKHDLTDLQFAELLRIPLSSVKEILNKEFLMSRFFFQRIIKVLGEKKESDLFLTKLHGKLSQQTIVIRF